MCGGSFRRGWGEPHLRERGVFGVRLVRRVSSAGREAEDGWKVGTVLGK